MAAECAGALRPEHEREVDDAFLSLVSRIDHAPDDATPALAHMAETLFQQRLPAEKKSSLPLVLVGAALLALLAWWASGPILRGLHERRIDAAFAQALTAHPELDAFPLRVTVDHAARTVTLAGLVSSDAAAGAVEKALEASAAPYRVVAHTASINTVQQAEETRKRQEQIGTELADLTGRLATLSARVSDADATLAAQSAANKQSDDALRAEARDISDRLTALSATAARTPREKLIAMLADTAIYFSRQDTFADRAVAEKRASQIAAALKGNDLALRVVGYTDSTGGERRNLVIGQMRATAVAELLAAQGVDKARLRIVTRPGFAQTGAESDPRDRRVTFELASMDEPRP